MRDVAKQLRLRKAVLSLASGLLMIGFLGACSSVDVKVDNTCSPGSVRKIIDPPDETGAGACKPKTVPTNQDAYGFLNTANSNQAITDHVHTCNANTTMCKTAAEGGPGNCLVRGQYRACKSYFTPTSGNAGNCTCGCPP